MEKALKEKSSKRIKELRLARGYTMEKLAEMMGVSKSTIAKWENGYVENMRQDRVEKLANLFSVSPTYILGYDDTSFYSIFDDHIKTATNEQATIQRLKNFVALYSQLEEADKTVVDKLIKSLTDND